MTLRELPLDLPCRVRAFSPMEDGELARLQALGLRVGASVTKLLRTPLRDPVACLVGPQVLALDERLMSLIHVEPARP